MIVLECSERGRGVFINLRRAQNVCATEEHAGVAGERASNN